MKAIYKATCSLSLIATTFISSSALAVDPGLYGTAGIGISNFSEQALRDVCDAGGVPCEVDNSPLGVRFGLGYKFSPYFSLEGGYMNLGEVNYSVLGTDVVSFSAKGPYASLLGELPLGNSLFSLLGSVGASYLEGELSSSPLLGGVDLVSEQGAIAFVGAGIAINSSTGRSGARIMWERINPDQTYELNGIDIDAPDINLYTLSFVFRF